MVPYSHKLFTVPYPEPLESSSHPHIIILFFHLCLYIPSGVFLSGFRTKILYAFLISPMLTVFT